MSPLQLNLPFGQCQDTISPTSRREGALPLSKARTRNGNDRLFVPLATEPFRWFCSGNKLWELRKLGRQYTLEHVRPGRNVELRRGYGDPKAAIWGAIVDVVQAANVVAFFEVVPWWAVLPESDTLDHAIEQAIKILKIDDPGKTPVLGFRIERVDS